MIGDRDVFEAARLCRRHHRLEALATVGLGRVHVQVALEIRPRDQRGQRPGGGGFDLAAVLAQLRLDERQSERLVDVLLRSRRRSAVSSASKRPYSFSFQPRSSARSRSAMLCAFEPVKYCRAAPRCSGVTMRRSAWKPPRSSTLALVPPLASTRSTCGKLREGVGEAGVGAAREDVEIAAGLGAATHAADRGDVGRRAPVPSGTRRARRPFRSRATAGDGRRSAAAPRSPGGSAAPSCCPCP